MITKPETPAFLSQSAFLRGTQRFHILPDGNLEYTFKRLTVYRQFKIPLWQIDPSRERIKLCPPGPIAGMLIFGIFILVIIGGMVETQRVCMAVTEPLMDKG